MYKRQGTVTEIVADAAFTDLRGQTVLPLLLRLMETGDPDDAQQQVVGLMRNWMDAGSRNWIDGGSGLGAYRRDRHNDGAYDQRAAVVLMDAWHERLIDNMPPQLEGLPTLLQGRYDAPVPGPRLSGRLVRAHEAPARDDTGCARSHAVPRVALRRQ